MTMTAATCTVRPVRRSDAPQIAALSAQLGYPATPIEIEQRLDEFARVDAAILVAELDDAVTGWIAVERRITLESGVAFEITGLVVDANRRRTGAGRALVDAAGHWACERGADALVVRSNVAREASHPFYAGLGFTRTKTQHVYRRAITPASNG